MAAKRKQFTAKKGKVKLVLQKPAYVLDEFGTSKILAKEYVSVTLQYPQAFDVAEVLKKKEKFIKWSQGYQVGFDKNKGEKVFKKLTADDLYKFLENKVNSNPKICFFEDRPRSKQEMEWEARLAKEKEITIKAQKENDELRAKLAEIEAKKV